MNFFGKLALGATAMMLWATAALAQDVTLRLHHFLPPQATIPTKILQPWIDEVETKSGGRIKIDSFPAMSLGGTMPELVDQALDGAVDLSLIVMGTTPGRFPRTEAFVLPFMMTNAEATSKAFWEFANGPAAEEFKDIHLLGTWVHGPGVVHSMFPVTSAADLKGRTFRGPSQPVNKLLEEVGANTVGIPITQVVEALSKGVVDGFVTPWEVTMAYRSSEVVTDHTEFTGDRALYTARIALVMNKARYDALPDDLKAVIDSASGLEFSGMAGREIQAADSIGRDFALAHGNTIHQIDEAGMAPWRAASDKVKAGWVVEMDAQGLGGRALLDQANALIEKYSK